MKTNRKKRFRLFKRLLIFGFLAAILLTYFYIPRFVVEINNPILNWIGGNKSLVDSPKYAEKNGEFFHFTSKDGYKMEAFILHSQLDTIYATIILLHGIRANKELFIPVAEDLAQRGFQTVDLDLRAHGNSEGEFCTFGVKEKEDVSTLIDSLNAQQKNKGKVGIWGFSLGGAVALQAMAEDKRIQFGVIESTFNSMNSIGHSYANLLMGFDWEPLTNFMIWRSGQIADFNPNEASPLNATLTITQPILITHGAKDEKISWQEGYKNYQNIASKDKKFIKVEDAYHTTLWRSKTMDYLPTVYGEIERMAKE